MFFEEKKSMISSHVLRRKHSCLKIFDILDCEFAHADLGVVGPAHTVDQPNSFKFIRNTFTAGGGG